MAISHDILVAGSNLSFRGGFFGFSSIVLVRFDGAAPLLFDTGHHATRGLLLAALGARGLAPSDIGTVVLSHLHFDHINNADLFPDARFVVSNEELRYAAAPAPDDLYLPGPMVDWLRQRDLQRIDGDGELLPGLMHRAAPGHTPGQQTLTYVDAEERRVTLAGDAVKTYRELADQSLDLEFDPEQRGAATLRWIAANSDVIVPGHHPELRRTNSGWTWDIPTSLELIVR